MSCLRNLLKEVRVKRYLKSVIGANAGIEIRTDLKRNGTEFPRQVTVTLVDSIPGVLLYLFHRNSSLQVACYEGR